MNPSCVLLWISVVGCNPVARNYLDAACTVPARHLVLVRKVEMSREDHTFVTPALGRISLPHDASTGSSITSRTKSGT